MSLASHAMGRLRELYSIVWRKNQLLNQQRQQYPADMHNAALGALMEELEPRILLSGTTFVVNSLADVVANDGVVTLREAIQAADTNTAVCDAPAGSGTETDVITFDQTALQAEAGAGNPLVITLNGTELQFINNLDIRGPGADVLTIDANHQSRVFLVGSYSTSANNSASFSGLTFTNGNTSGTTGNYSDSGSAICGGGCKSIYVSNCIFTGNEARRGTIYGSASSTLTIENSLIVGNTAELGGGIYGFYPVVMNNTTIAGNWSGSYGGGIRSETIFLNNSIVSGNDAVDGDINIYGDFISNHSLVGENAGFVRDPSAGLDGVWGTEDDDLGDLHLTATSTAVNAGDNSLISAGITTDLEGNARIADGIVDAGAYEFQGAPAPGREAPSMHVTTTADVIDLYDGEISLREALWYNEQDDGLGDVITFDPSLSGQSIILHGEELIIDGNISMDASAISERITIDANYMSRVFHVRDNAIVDFIGLTITGGYTQSLTGSNYSDGIRCESNCTVTIINCRITGNSGIRGAIYATDSNITIQNSEFIQNNTKGAYFLNSVVTVSDSVISNNSGTGISSSGSAGQITIQNSSLIGNRGCGLLGTNVDMTNCLVGGNVSQSGSWTELSLSGISTVTNSIIHGNAIDGYSEEGILGYGISVHGTLFLNNSIVYGNSGNIDSHEIYVSDSSGSAILYADHNIIEGGLDEGVYLSGTNASVIDNGGNLADDPLFIHNPLPGADGRWGTSDDDYGDLRLQFTSPGINAGNNTLIPVGVTTDFRGEARIVDGIVDIGLYEFDGPEIVLSSGWFCVAEGGNTTVGVALTNQPSVDVVVTLTLAGDADLTIPPTTLTFTPSNWDTYQYVTISAAEDMDPFDGKATLTAAADGLISHTTTVTETDNDPEYIVDTLVDEDDGDYSKGDMSLREAIKLANITAGTDEIVFDQAALEAEAGPNVPLVITLDGEPDAYTSTLKITDDLIITGLGPDILTVDAKGFSGVFRIISDVSATIQGLTITGGYISLYGGGISALSGSQLTVINCNIIRNQGGKMGGGIYGWAQSSITVIDSFFAGNEAIYYLITPGNGGGIAGDTNSTINVINSVFVGNTASHGNAIYGDDSTITITNSTITGDNAVYGYGDSTLTVNNSILTYNTWFALHGSNNLIDVDPEYVRNPDPGVDSSWGTEDDDYGDLRLMEGSPAIDAGDNAYVPAEITTDIRGVSRIVDGTVDIGAYEFNGPEFVVSTHSLRVHEGRSNTFEVSLTGQPIYDIAVSISHVGDADLSADSSFLIFTRDNWNVPQTVTISSAVDADDMDGEAVFTVFCGVIPPQSITVTENEYEYVVDTLVDEDDGDYSVGDLSLREAIRLANETPGEEDITFDQAALQTEAGTGNPLVIILNGTQLDITDDVGIVGLGADVLTIDANGQSAAFYVYGDISSTFDALTITGADSTGGINGVAVNDESPYVILKNCVVTQNEGVGVASKYVWATNCRITYNEGHGISSTKAFVTDSVIQGNHNGGIYCYYENSYRSGTVVVDHSLIADNIGVNGAGIYGRYITINHSEIVNNHAYSAGADNDGKGGGISAHGTGILTITDSIIRGNTALRDGGGVYIYDRIDYVISNSIIQGNTSLEGFGGGIYAVNNWKLRNISNAAISNNTAVEGGGIYADRISIANSTITGNVAESLGGGVVCKADDYFTPTLDNSIVAMNQAETNADISGTYIGSNNLIGVDPGFIRNSSFGPDGQCATDDDDYGDLRLLSTSIGINAGDNSLIPGDVTTDLAGRPRIFDGTVDIGAYEYNGPEVALSQNRIVVTEGGNTTVDVVLTEQPDDDVIVTIIRTSGDEDLFAAPPAALTFTPDNWDTPQSFTITAAEDADNVTGTAEFTVSAAGMTDQILQAEEVDNDYYLVDTLADEDDGDYSAGDLSLREAIALANATPGEETIKFDAVALLGGGSNPIRIILNGTQLEITDELIIQGLGAEMLIIDAGNLSRVFYIEEDYTSVTFSGLTITGGKVPDFNSGGGIYGGTVTIIDSQVIQNRTSRGAGGGIYSETVIVINSIIAENEAKSYSGGGINGTYVTVIDSLITDNKSSEYGGGIYGSNRMTIVNSTIENNQAYYGSGIFVSFDCVAVITDSLIRQNNPYPGSYTKQGGGIYVASEGSLYVLNTEIIGNSSGAGGGIYATLDADVELVNTILVGNQANYGGGIYNYGAWLVLKNSAIVSNSADKGGGIYETDNIAEVYTILQNSILTWNEAAEGANIYGDLNASFFILLDTDPGFYRNPFIGSDGEWGTSDDDYGDLRLIEGSAAINAGHNTIVPDDVTLDLGGTPRIIDGTVDIGAYEFNGAEIVVSTHSIAVKEGESKTFTVALTNQPDSDVIVHITRTEGDTDLSAFPTELTFTPENWDIPQDVTITSVEDADFLEGKATFAVSSDGVATQTVIATEKEAHIVDTLVDEDDGNYFVGDLSLREAIRLANEECGADVITFNQTALQAEAGAGNPLVINLSGEQLEITDDLEILGLGADVLTIRAHNETPEFYINNSNSSISPDVAIYDLTIQAGEIYGNDSSLSLVDCVFNGTNIVNNHGEALLERCIIQNNTTVGFSSSGNVTMSECTITHNKGGIVNSGIMTLYRCEISHNTSDSYQYAGAGIKNTNTLELRSCKVTQNIAQEGWGGGIASYATSSNSQTLTIIDSIIVGNEAEEGGGIQVGDDTQLLVTNSTIVGNIARDGIGGGIFNGGDGTNLTLNNSIVTRNEASDDYSNIYGLYEDNNSVVGFAPDFVRNPDSGADGVWGTADDDLGDLHLQDTSFAINMGDNILAVDGQGDPLTEDLDGNPRISDETVDLGAYEFQGPPSGLREIPSTIVTTLEDVVDGGDGKISLREAMFHAIYGGLASVTFDPSLAGGTIILSEGSLYTDQSLTIDASGAGKITISADCPGTIFEAIGDGINVELVSLDIIRETLEEDTNRGSGIYFDANDLVLTDCTVSRNMDGRGVYFRGNTLHITDSVIEKNFSTQGSGIYLSKGTLYLSNSRISDNESTGYGGGIYAYEDTTVYVTDSTITGNSTGYDSWNNGGGIYGDEITVINTIISGNSARRGGGIYVAHGSPVQIINSVISGNQGCGIYDEIGPGSTIIYNSTIAGNSGEDGGGIHGYNFELYNTIVANNESQGSSNISGTYSGSNNLIDLDPAFVRNPSDGGDGWRDNPDTEGVDEGANDDYGDLRLRATSAAINLGDNALIPAGITTDLDGNPRIADGTVDIGAYEYQGAPAPGRETPSLIVTTAEDIFDIYDGLISLREALWYDAQIDALGDTITFGTFLSGQRIILDGYELFIENDLQIDASALVEGIIVDGNQNNRVFHVSNDTVAEFFNLTITGGYTLAEGAGIFGGTGSTITITDSTILENQSEDNGGGIKGDTVVVLNSSITNNEANGWGGGINGSAITIQDSFIDQNIANGWGGGVAGGIVHVTNSIVSGNTGDYRGGGVSGSEVTILSSTISNNSGGYSYCEGGGIYAETIVVEDSLISGNISDGPGGGLYGESLSVTNSRIIQNTSRSGSGGGICIYDSEMSEITNSIIAGNVASENGGGISFIYSDTLIVINSTIVANRANPEYGEGGGIYGTAQLYNSIISFNEADWKPQLSGYEAYNCLIDDDPEFLRNPYIGDDGRWGTEDDDYGDLRFRQTSPAYNAGENAFLPAGVTTDIAGNPRIVDGIVDIGAHEFNGPEIYMYPGNLSVREGTSNTFTVEITGQPEDNVTVTVERTAGDSDLTVPPTTLLFTPSNWDIPQTVTVFAAEDADGTYGQAIFTASSVGIASQFIVVTEVDNEPDYLVDTLVDEDDGNYSTGDLSLREAIHLSNNKTGLKEIGFNQAALQAEAGAGNPIIITLDGTALQITDDLSIQGLGADVLTVDADGNSQVFVVANGVTVTFADMTITGGYLSYPSYYPPYYPPYYFGCGGGIAVSEYCNVTVLNTKIVGNYAGYGGGIGLMGRYGGSSLSLVNSVVAGNSAAYGGGIFVYGYYYSGYSNLSITNSTITGNYAQRYAGVYAPYSVSELNNSIVALNQADMPYYPDITNYEGSNNIVGDDPGFVRNPSDGGDGWGDNPYTAYVDESLNDDYGDLRLAVGSVGIDGGDNLLLPADEFDLDGDGNTTERLSLDLAGNKRIVDGDRNGTAFVDIGAYEYVPEGILNRYVFYNNSYYDGNDPAANANDDAAIAPDKVALLPGQTATFANYTSYSKGINGIMIDLLDLAGVPTASDFTFKVGNSSDPDTWIDAPAPADITLRAGDGIYYSARITITWADNDIEKQWLQVTMLSDAHGGSLGLAQDDVFYFGNAIGETGDTADNAVVNITDELNARKHPAFLPPATIENLYDFNRDRLVNTTDQLIARKNTTFLDALRLITVPEYVSGTGAAPLAMSAFTDNESSSEGVVGRYVVDAAFVPEDDSSDDGIVLDVTRQVLLPGQTATAANYTTDSYGLRGIVIDILDLSCAPVAGDFMFRMGDTNDLSSWTAAPEPMEVLISEGDGIYGSDRVTLLWAECEIRNTWLEVTVLSDAHGGSLGLTMDDVFYVGNVVNDMTDLVLLDLAGENNPLYYNSLQPLLS